MFYFATMSIQTKPVCWTIVGHRVSQTRLPVSRKPERKWLDTFFWLLGLALGFETKSATDSFAVFFAHLLSLADHAALLPLEIRKFMVWCSCSQPRNTSHEPTIQVQQSWLFPSQSRRILHSPWLCHQVYSSQTNCKSTRAKHGCEHLHCLSLWGKGQHHHCQLWLQNHTHQGSQCHPTESLLGMRHLRPARHVK